MLEKLDFSKKRLDKATYKSTHDDLVKKLIVLQQQARNENIGLVVLFEGWNGAGKGSRISDLLYNLDARATTVHVPKDIDEEEADYFQSLGQGVSGYFPAMQEFWQALGPRGNITFYDQGWYAHAVQEMLFTLFGRDFGKSGKKAARDAEKKLAVLMEGFVRSAREFEGQLANDGYTVVKFFLHISEKEQRERLTELYNDPAQSWRVSKKTLEHAGNYQQAYQLYDDMLERSDNDTARWVLVDGEDKRQANLTIAATLVDALERALGKAAGQASQAGLTLQKGQTPQEGQTPHEEAAAPQGVGHAPADAQRTLARAPLVTRFAQAAQAPSLDAVDYGVTLPFDEYRSKLKAEQERLNGLELEMFLKRIPLLAMFEGWDAAGKGGAIKRVAQALDARSYTIFPSPAPTPIEKLHPHLWRYWTRLPKAGHVGIYDRSWYGRVLVERVEGFATPDEVFRAYDEINGFEQELLDWGAILLKFWVEVSPEEQLRRFEAREADPDKQWKITEDDWRNRDKYPLYREAVGDMFRLTSTALAPWVILESEDKFYSRVKTLQVINDTLERRLRETSIPLLYKGHV